MRRRDPASLAQQGIWFTEQVGGAGSVYHMPLAIRLEGDVNVRALVDACEAAVAHHPILAGAFQESDGVPYLVPAVHRPHVAHVDLATAPEHKAAPQMADLVRREILRPFDLRRGPLARFTLCRLAPRRFLLLAVMHHLVFDGESKDVLVRDLACLYGAFASGSRSPLPELPPFREQVADERRRTEAALATARELWSGRWREPDAVALPGLTLARPGVDAGEALPFALDPELDEALDEGAPALGATRFELVLTALLALLRRYGNEEPAVVVDLGTRTPLTRDCVGLFVNELPVTAAVGSAGSFAELLQATRAQLRDRYAVREVPLARAVPGIGPRVALAPVSLSYRRRAGDAGFAGLDASVDWAMFNLASRNALHVMLVDGPDALAGSLVFSPRAIDRESVEGIGVHLVTLLRAALSHPDARVADLPLLATRERARLVAAGAGPSVARDPEATVPALVAAQPSDGVAIAFDGGGLTYGELAAAVAALARRLLTGSLVAVCAERSPELAIGVLAVLQAGAAYVPLDPAHPPARLASVLADAGPALLLTQERLLGRFEGAGVPTLLLDGAASERAEPFPASPAPDALAYVIATSGSTGRPKGVEVSHRSLANLLLAMRDALGSSRGDAWLAHTSPSFDISALELFLPLVTGGRVVLAGDADARDGAALLRLVRAHAVTHVQATPSGWRMLVEAGFAEPGVVALCGGEPLPVPLARELRGRVARLLNVYGPTETTIWSTLFEVPAGGSDVTIGMPIANTRAHVLDARLEPVPAGLAGELCLGGDGLARGYRGRPAQTASRFVPDPFGPPGARLYRTGDRCRRRPDGALVFLGRSDDQVKVRGHRVELGEVEAALAGASGVAAAAVALRGDRLVAYIVPADGASPGAPDLRRHLAAALPEPMVPGAFVLLERLPLTASGKVDRAALPAPPPARAEDAGAPAGEHSELARAVGDICREVMKIGDIRADESLFDLGGHSLTMTMIASRIRKRLQREVPLHVFHDNPTIAGIVEALTG